MWLHTSGLTSVSTSAYVPHAGSYIFHVDLHKLASSMLLHAYVWSGDNSAGKCLSLATLETPAAYFLALKIPHMHTQRFLQTSTFTFCFLPACKWFQAAGILSFRTVYSWNKRAALCALLFSQCILSQLKRIDWDLGLGYSSQGTRHSRDAVL